MLVVVSEPPRAPDAYICPQWIMDGLEDRGLNQDVSQVAHEFLLREPQATLRTLPAARDLGITAEMTARFRPLAVQMYGKERVPTGYL